MKLYCLGPVQPRFITIASASNANPIVVTTTGPHGLTVNDPITISGVLVNTNANGTYMNMPSVPGFQPMFSVPSPTTISLLMQTGNGAGVATGFASGPRQVVTAANFPSIPGVTDNTKLMVAKILFIPGPHGTASLFIGTTNLNQYSLVNVMRAINPPPTAGIYDYYTLDGNGYNSLPIADYWIDAALPGSEGPLVSFWIK